MGISPQQFEQMKRRIGGARRAPGPVLDPVRLGSERAVILGIDPSLRGTGYGVIRSERRQQSLLAQGTIVCPPAWRHSQCLAHISQALRRVIAAHHPTICVVEGLFYAQNFQTALIMGEARGVAIAVAAEAGMPIYEIATRKVKQAIVGYGAARKLAVAKMVQRLLALAEPPAEDAADALALALAHLQAAHLPARPQKSI